MIRFFCRNTTLLVLLLFSLDARRAQAGSYYPDIVAYDAPYNRNPNTWPSMRQGLLLTKSAYQLLHDQLERHLDPRAPGWDGFWNALAFGGIDIIAGYLPPFDSWLHEEYHRNVLGLYNISSYNGVYDLPLGASSIAVYKIKDEELIKLKKNHPKDMIRLPAAGIEGQLDLINSLRKDQYFLGERGFHEFLVLMELFNGYFYISSGTSTEADTFTDERNEVETEISQRDFVGHDFTSWVYDLHRQDEPYESRGTHPSGNGINRYRKYSDLTREEVNFLTLQSKLYLLNFIDPWIWLGPKKQGEMYFHGRHYLTAFGSASSLHFYNSTDFGNVILGLTGYRNKLNWFPGLQAELFHQPLAKSALGVYKFSLLAQVWQQPKNLDFDTREARPGAFLRARFYWPLFENSDYYIEGEQKTQGWVNGTPYLDRNFSLRLGTQIYL